MSVRLYFSWLNGRGGQDIDLPRVTMELGKDYAIDGHVSDLPKNGDRYVMRTQGKRLMVTELSNVRPGSGKLSGYFNATATPLFSYEFPRTVDVMALSDGQLRQLEQGDFARVWATPAEEIKTSLPGVAQVFSENRRKAGLKPHPVLR